MRETRSSTVIDGVGRVAVPVTDQDRALEFYVEKLGFEVRADGNPPPLVEGPGSAQ